MRWALGLAVLVSMAAHAQEVARGMVYVDANKNAALDEGEQGVADVVVSNGLDVVKTDADGRWELPVTDDTIIHVVKPVGYMTRINDKQLPRFFYIHKPAGSPELRYPGVAPTGPLPDQINFPLYPREESDTFKGLFFGDTQPYSMQEIYWIANDVAPELIGTDASFAVSLGDLVGDNLNLFEPLNDLQSLIGIPFYNVLGNHDIDFKADDDKYSDETYEAIYGPTYYAFEKGKVTFIVLEDVDWQGDGYEGGIGETQLKWLQNFLAITPKDRLIVMMMHIPLPQVEERRAIFEALAPFPHTFSISGHWHTHRHFFLDESEGWQREGETHHHLVNVTVSGSWWDGAIDYYGIPETPMRDGAPNGYTFITFDGTDYEIEFKAARRPKDFQMAIHTPWAIPQSHAAKTEVVANVFNGSERCKTEMRIGDGEWLEMEYTVREDPFYVARKEREAWLAEMFSMSVPEDKREDFDLNTLPVVRQRYGTRLPDARESYHLWVATLPEDMPEGFQVIEVRATDMFGNVHHGRRIIHVK